MTKKPKPDKAQARLDQIFAEEIPPFMQKMAKAQAGPFRPPIFDLIRRKEPK